MLEITGGTSATALTFIFPAMRYTKLSAPHKPWYSRSKLPAVACTTFGVVILCISLFLALGKAWTSACREGNHLHPTTTRTSKEADALR